MKIFFNGFLVSAFLLLMISCSIQPIQPAMHDFGLLESNTFSASNKSLITVNAPTWLWDNRIRYRLLYQAATQIRFYGLDLWIASPPELIEQFLTNNLTSTNYPLTIQLLTFEQQFESTRQAKVVLSFLVDVYSPDHKNSLASKMFTLTQTTPTPDAKGAVQGFTILVQQASVQIQNWLRQLFKTGSFKEDGDYSLQTGHIEAE